MNGVRTTGYFCGIFDSHYILDSRLDIQTIVSEQLWWKRERGRESAQTTGHPCIGGTVINSAYGTLEWNPAIGPLP